ncbi:MAG: helix-turn-helix domain-containing protein [Proteobacteria bacterium]|nr:helix-turn-helix domain-containing protein [Pseudomonadota bacterium]
MICPNCGREMILEKVEKVLNFRGRELAVTLEQYRCHDCGLEAGTVDQAGCVQNAIADAWRLAEGFLTGREIRSLREARSWTQAGLARAANLDPAAIRRWENGCIQPPEADRALRLALEARENQD